MKRNLLMIIFVVGLLAACSDSESGNAGSLANALAGKTFDLDLDTTSSSCSADTGTASASDSATDETNTETAYSADTAAATEGTFLVKHTHETNEDTAEGESGEGGTVDVEPASPISAGPASYTITFASSTYTIKSGSTVVETGTWKAIDGNTAEVKSDGVTTRVNVDVDGETLYVSTTAADCSDTTSESQPMEETSASDSSLPTNDTADDSTNDADYYYYVDDYADDGSTLAPTITDSAWDSY